jgi:hypothetical protein
LAQPEIRIRPPPRIEEDDADRGRVRGNYQNDTVDLTPYVRAIGQRRAIIVLGTVFAAAVTALITGLVLAGSYRAAAVIRPISTPAVESRISGLLGGLGGGLEGGMGGLAASLGAGSNNDAEEYIAILEGFQFNVSLVERHQLAGLLKSGPLTLLFDPKPRDPNWMIYRALKRRFDCDYSIKTGNITLYYQARDRREAEQVLGYYISDLRDLLRAREINDASGAIESLEGEARTSPDAVMRSELYELVAKQVQRKKMAQVEADFAFRVLDPPAASDKRYRPQILLDCLLAAVLTLLSLVAWASLSSSVDEPIIKSLADSSAR